MSVTMADSRASKKILDAKKPIDRVQSLAETIIYCMSQDAPIAEPASNIETPSGGTPVPLAVSRLQNGHGLTKSTSTDSLAAAGQRGDHDRRFLAGSRALDHLARLLTSCETVRGVLTHKLLTSTSSFIQVIPDIGLPSLPCSSRISPQTSLSVGKLKKSPCVRRLQRGG